MKNILVLTFSLALAALSTQALSNQPQLLKTIQDSSKKITVSVFKLKSPNQQQHFTDFAVSVPGDFVAIGGGVTGAHTGGNGNLITASYPNHSLTAWLVSTKDHLRPHSIYIEAYAIGLKVEGLTRAELRNYISVNSSTSGWGPHPEALAYVDAGHKLIGGGINVQWDSSTAGNIATASYPQNSYSWSAKSKDHLASSYGEATSYAIGIEEYIPNVGIIEVSIEDVRSGNSSHPSAISNMTTSFALTGCGAEVHWSGDGSLLWELKPSTEFTQHGCKAGAKDHLRVSPASITTYAIGIKAN